MGYEKNRRPRIDQLPHRYLNENAVSTAASTALAPRGLHIINTTSTAPTLFTLTDPKKGDVLEVSVQGLAATSSQSPVRIIAQSSGAFGYAAASTAQNMVTIAVPGGALRAVALNSSEWAVLSGVDVLLSTST